MRKEDGIACPNESRNYSFTTLILPTDFPIEPDRTRPTATRAGTAHALFTGWWSLLFRGKGIQMCLVLRPWGKVQGWKKKKQRDRERAGGFISNVDSFNECTDLSTSCSLDLIHLPTQRVCVSPCMWAFSELLHSLHLLLEGVSNAALAGS